MMVLISWMLYGALLVCFAIFLFIVFRDPGRVAGKRKKSPGRVRLGALLQSASYMLAWTFRRPRVDPFGGAALWPDIVIALGSLAIALGAIVLAKASKKHLGRHWALAARVVEGHHLVTDGPFARVRHPLYLAMGLLLLSPVIGLSSWLGVGLSVPLFLIGTSFRVRAEESVLVEEFGREYDEYRRRVPPFFPRLGSAQATAAAGRVPQKGDKT
jgi:protein-S-isoprenylcysteine O-methyltransferase Ste14